MYNVVVCDDNVAFLNVVVAILNKYAELYKIEVIAFDDGYEALGYCLSNKFDIVYMDIEIKTLNGMSLAKKLKEMNPNVLIIYISAYECYYVDMVQAEPFRFIHKDMFNLEVKVVDTLDAAMRRINCKDMWSFRFNGNRYSIELKKVKYFHSLARTIHIVGNIGEQDYFYGKLDDLQCELEKIDTNFVRINKSCIVNTNYCYMVIGKRNQIKIDNKIFSVTAKYRAAVKEKITGCYFVG